jgi:hypothetical protein
MRQAVYGLIHVVCRSCCFEGGAGVVVFWAVLMQGRENYIQGEVYHLERKHLEREPSCLFQFGSAGHHWRFPAEIEAGGLVEGSAVRSRVPNLNTTPIPPPVVTIKGSPEPCTP